MVRYETLFPCCACSPEEWRIWSFLSPVLPLSSFSPIFSISLSLPSLLYFISRCLPFLLHLAVSLHISALYLPSLLPLPTYSLFYFPHSFPLSLHLLLSSSSFSLPSSLLLSLRLSALYEGVSSFNTPDLAAAESNSSSVFALRKATWKPAPWKRLVKSAGTQQERGRGWWGWRTRRHFQFLNL